jgi:hypothetical protein
VIVNGCLLLGRKGLAAEIGHMSISDGGPVCSCGNSGCWEALAPGTALSGWQGSGPKTRRPKQTRLCKCSWSRRHAISVSELQIFYTYSRRSASSWAAESPKCSIGSSVRSQKQSSKELCLPFAMYPLCGKARKKAGLVGAASLILR